MKKIKKIGLSITVFALAVLVIACEEYDMYHIPEKKRPKNKVHVSEVILDKSLLLLEVGETATLTAMVYPADTPETELTWLSNDPDIATIFPVGNDMVVTAVAKGSTEIIVQSNLDSHKTACCAVKVDPLTGLHLPDGTFDSTVNSIADVVAVVNASPGNYVYVPTVDETLTSLTLTNAHSTLTITSTAPVSITHGGTGTAPLFTITKGTLIVGGQVTLNGGDRGSVVDIAWGSKFKLEGNAKITGGKNPFAAGGGVIVSGIFTMNGGEISGNTAGGNGGGVYVPGGTFIMNGGIITGNTTSGSGGGVYITGGIFDVFTPASTASIYNNTAGTMYPQVSNSGGTFMVDGALTPNY